MNKPPYSPDTYSQPTNDSTIDGLVNKKSWPIRIMIACCIGIICAGFACYLYLRYAPLPPNAIIDTSKVYGEDGSILTDYVSGGSRIKVPLKSIPKSLQDATLAVEDAQFYQHGALNWRSIARALWVDLKSGQVEQGGSTITQQLARNLYLTQARTWVRKIREAIYSFQLEMHYSKQSILEQYLNVIYYGNGAKGVESAAEFYFGKPVQQLDLAETSMLAGIPNGPSIYAPFSIDHDQRDFSNYKNAKLRQKTVLDAMYKQHFITKSQEQKAYEEPLKFSNLKQHESIAPYFTDYLKSVLQSKYGLKKDDLYRGGLSIHSTIDTRLQKAAEKAVANNIPANSKLQVALVAMDPRTGDIKAMVGGRNYSQSTFNRVLSARQPGSSFKPVLYLTALQNGFTPATRIKSAPTTFLYGEHGRTYDVHNFANIYQNHDIDMREAIAKSDNVYAVATGLDIGLDKVIATSKKVGITTNLNNDPMEPYPSLALGVFPVSPLQMARAYAVLANGGKLVQPRVFTSIDNAYGNQVVTQDVQEQQVEDPRYTYILTDLMKNVFKPGGTAARIANDVTRPTAGKTGTTDTDAWMIGYTPDLVTVVWVGYDQGRLLSATESHLAAPIWGDFMHAYEQTTVPQAFAKPSGLERVQIDPESGQLATANCPVKEWDYFLQSDVPKETCTLHPEQVTSKKMQPHNHSAWFDSLWNWVTGK